MVSHHEDFDFRLARARWTAALRNVAENANECQRRKEKKTRRESKNEKAAVLYNNTMVFILVTINQPYNNNNNNNNNNSDSVLHAAFRRSHDVSQIDRSHLVCGIVRRGGHP
jgi:hypothetical protein